MKKLIAFTLILCTLVSAMSLTVFALTKNGSWGEVPMYIGGLAIDGKLDDAYNYGLIIDCKTPFRDSYKCATTAKCYVLHDGSFLYCFISVDSEFELSDYNMKYDGENHWNTTGLELMIDWSNDAASQNDIHKYMGWYDNSIFGGFLSKGKEKETISDYKCTVDKAAKKWTAELKLNFMEGAKVGSEIGFNFMINSDATMGANKDATRKITAFEAEISNAGEKYKNVTLSSKSAAVPVPETTAAAAAGDKAPAAAAQTSDALVYILTAAVMSGACLTVFRKKK